MKKISLIASMAALALVILVAGIYTAQSVVAGNVLASFASALIFFGTLRMFPLFIELYKLK